MSKNTKSERTRQEILDKAWDLIASQGADISLADIAARVGLTRQSIYVHFGSRGGLLMALVRRADERFEIWETMADALQAETAIDRLDGAMAAWFDFVPKIHPVATDLIRLRGQDDAAAKAWEDRMADLRAVFKDVVAGLRKEGALADHWSVPKAADYLWVGCSMQAWSLLVKDLGWSERQASTAIRYAMRQALLN